jgi:hypothetical protein
MFRRLDSVSGDREYLHRLGPSRYFIPEKEGIFQSPKRCGFLNKNRTMDSVQKHNISVTQIYLASQMLNPAA